MLLVAGSRAAAIVSTSERSRPVITAGPMRTLRTDTGQIIRAGASQIGTATTSVLFQNATWANGRALGLNCMRCGVNSSTSSMNLNTLLANIDLVVERARVNRMYCMLGYFAASPGSWWDAVTANTAKWITFWQAASARYRDVPHVFYEMVNEPTRWGNTTNYNAAVKEGLKDIYDVMRAGAPDTVIVWPSAANLDPSAASYAALMASFDTLGNGQPVNWNKAALGFHYYNKTQTLAVSGGTANATDAGRAGLRSLGATYPLMQTETNWYVEDFRIGLVDALDVLEELGIGWTLLRSPGQTEPYPLHQYDPPPAAKEHPPLGPAFLDNKIAQLRDRGFSIPVE